MTKKETKIIVDNLITICNDIRVYDIIMELQRRIPALKEPFDLAIKEHDEEVDFEEEVAALAKKKFALLGHDPVHWMCNNSFNETCNSCISDARKELEEW